MKIFAFGRITAISCICICTLAACDPDEDGLRTTYFAGSKQVKQTVEYKNGRKNGYLKEYYPDGTLKAIQYFVNDTLDDTTRIYHRNGRLKTIRTYKNKRRHGVWRDYNPDGGVYAETSLADGLLHGTSRRYSYRSLKLQTRVDYETGSKHGLEERYYDNGQIQSRVTYRFGNTVGEPEEWDSNGKPLVHDFEIYVTEKDETLLNNRLLVYVRLENPQPGDQVFQLMRADNLGSGFALKQAKDGSFVLEMPVNKGSFVMEEITLMACRITPFRNTVMRKKNYKVVSNNF